MKFLQEVSQWLQQVLFTIFSPKVPVQTSAPDPLAAAILKYNNSLLLFKMGPTWTNGVSTVHEINVSTATTVANAIRNGIKAYPALTAAYVAGCLTIESCDDPKAENKNDGAGGSNPTNDPGGYDEGVAQIKLKYLPLSDGTTDAQKLSFADNVADAVNYHCSIMAGNVEWAKGILATPSSAPNERFQNAYYLATAAYQAGRTGVMTVFNSGEQQTHANQVVDLERMFSKDIGEASVFVSIQ